MSTNHLSGSVLFIEPLTFEMVTACRDARISDTCIIPGCKRPYEARGWCEAHYVRYRRYGDPLGGGPVKTGNGAAWAYLQAHLRIYGDECLIWPFSAGGGGYGHVRPPGSKIPIKVHVLACEARWGARPPGMQAAHGPCHNRRCFNGEHVSWKTPKENSADRLRDGTLYRRLRAADT